MSTPTASPVGAWLRAFRLRTLPLAVSCIGMGSFLAAIEGIFSPAVFVLSVATTILLQILSNLANDYGDSVHGADSAERKGPQRTVQSGLISLQAMKRAMYLFGVLSFATGCGLLWASFGSAYWKELLVFLGLGLLAIWAAVAYTAGKNPYGYAGLGDLSVLVFFGWIGVLGTYFLYAKSAAWVHLLPATSCGLLAVAVLNVNNIRDIASDTLAGKRSLPVRMGRKNARLYHWALLLVAIGCAGAWVVLHFQSTWQGLFLVSVPLMLRNGVAVSRYDAPEQLDPFLKQMALTTLLFVLTFGVGNLIATV